MEPSGPWWEVKQGWSSCMCSPIPSHPHRLTLSQLLRWLLELSSCSYLPSTGGGRSHLFGTSPHHPLLLPEPRGDHHISTLPVGEAEEPGNIGSSERTFPHGRIQSRERTGEGGEPAFKPAMLAQPLVSGSTGNTLPCSPGKTCS